MCSSRVYRTLLDPHESVLLLIDHQPRMLAGVASGDRRTLCDNVTGLARTAKAFGVPTVLTGGTAEEFAAPLVDACTDAFPDRSVVGRTCANAWADVRVRDAVLATGRRQIVMAGLWTEIGLVLPALSALEEGREVYVVADASGGTSAEAHQLGIQRITQAGGVPLTWLQLLGEFQREGAGEETRAAVEAIVRTHGGAWGLGFPLGREDSATLAEARPS